MKKPVVSKNAIKIPSSPEFLSEVDIFVESKLQNYGIDRSTIADIAISVTEMVNNGITHGNKLNYDKIVTISVSKSDARVKIVVTDEGDGFNPDTIESPIEEKNLLKEVGRGIFIARSLMDEVKIDFLPGRGTRVTLTKHIADLSV
jgi:serine/threonine-protein kinase RsbW